MENSSVGRPCGHPYFHLGDAYKKEMKAMNIELNDWEKTAEEQRA